MADSTMAEVLKQFATKITTSSVKERCSILGELVPCVSQKEFPENAIKGILKHVVLTLGRYYDNKSRHAVEAVIQALADHQQKGLIKYFTQIIGDLAEQLKDASPCATNSGIAFSVLSWSCIVLKTCLKETGSKEEDVTNKLVKIQCLLTYGSLAARRKNLGKAVYNKLKRIWREVPGSIDNYINALKKLEASSYNFSLIGVLMKYLTVQKDQKTAATCKDGFLESYTKQVVGSRTQPPLHLLESCGHLLREANHEDFKETILPAFDRAMLRNPEIALETYTTMIAGLSIDLSQYAVDVGKHVATHLHSKEDTHRDIAAQGSKNLAVQCSDAGAVEKLVKYFFAVLNGSEGKLTGTVQRLGVLSGIGMLSYNTVSGATTVQNLSGAVAESFIPVLQQEAHEGTLVHALQMFALWCGKFTSEVPEKILHFFKDRLGQQKNPPPPAVRNGYLHCVNAAFNGDTLIQAMPLLPILLQTVEKASSQATQVALVTEGLTAACILIKLSLCDIQAESKLGKFWTILLDQEKQLFLNEKFLNQTTNEALSCLVTVIEKLILEHPQKVTDANSRSFYQALVFTLTHDSYKIRQQARAATKKITSVLGGPKIAIALIKEFRVLLNEQKLPDPNIDVLENGESVGDQTRTISPKILEETLSVLAHVRTADEGESHMVAMETLIDAHHPCIMAQNKNLWVDIVARLKLDVKDFIKGNEDDIIAYFKNVTTVTENCANSVATLSRVCPTVIVSQMVTYVCESLKKPGLSGVTKKEVSIYYWPEGDLFDKSVIDGGGGKQDESANLRRENKAYSYAEQMAELELKKELEKKKGKKVESKPKLSKKQQEALQAQLQKESEIRTKLKQMDQVVECACDLIEACLEGNPSELNLYLLTLLRCMVSLTVSPLASPRITKTYIKLRKAAFLEETDEIFELLLANSTLRLLHPQCDLDPAWSDEPLRKQTCRLVDIVYEKTVPAEEHGVDAHAFPASTLAYCFYFLRSVLQNGGENVGGNEAICLKALVALSEHAKLRSTNPEDLSEGPELLPRKEILSLLIQIIGTSLGKMQSHASKALVDFSKCGSGGDGCAAAEQDEVDVLLEGLLSPSAYVRETCLQGLLAMTLVLPTPDDDYDNGMKLMKRNWIAKYDVEKGNRTLADRLWEEIGLEFDPDLCRWLVADVVHHELVIRQAAADALAGGLKKHPDHLPVVMLDLLTLYEEKLYLPPPVLDAFGRVISEAPPDEWPARSGIGLALQKMSPYIAEDQIEELFAFFVKKSLGDRHEVVRKEMLSAAVAVINDHGKNYVATLLPVFENFLADAPTSGSFDAVRQSVVILMGSLAKHLDPSDPKVKPIVGKLVDTLSTPSQQVQEAVANCLPPLVPAIKDDAPDLVKGLLKHLLESDNYGERRGAAYGLAGLVKGLGILALKQLDIMSTLQEAIQNKKNPKHREGALFAFEMLCLMLGRLFEPYIVHILPHLLLCFGDTNQFVREAADDCAKAVMSKLSAHGVKLVLPSLLTALEEDSWRTKTGSVELLGAMAFCAPKQLSACLPNIVPKLTEVLTDSHVKVQKAGAQALKQIGSVIRNPEIQSIVPDLLGALQDPTKKTTSCLQTLLETKFVHFIDAPSLALIMPVVQRAFQDRSTETRKMAAQIIGNMYSLTDQKDLAPYLPAVIPGLKQSLLDPVPEVRNVSSRALGAIVKGMGESGYDDLVPWLMETLTSERNSVDRSGAAQGLSEVVGSLGLDKLEKLMPDIIQTAERDDIAPHVRDGYIMMYIYLPSVFGEEFIDYVGPILPSILKALADESEYVRDTALKAGQRIVNMYANTAIELLLPELENGLFDDNWRIRYSSVQLLGDLLYRISGVSGKMTTQGADEDDNFGTETSQKAILRVLGKDRRNRVLAGLYMGRSDTALLVRQAALHVWKIIVTHTPKMLREILPTLFSLLLGCLASTSYDKRQVAARTLGDIVRKLGEKVLPEIIPILEKGLESDRSDQRQGVCIGLTEIMSSTSRDHVLIFADSLIPTVRKALCDPLPEVREAAAKTFDNLHANIGPRALDEILPNLLKRLDDPDMSEYALDGLKQVMAVKSRVVLPYLVPQLTAKPVNTRALSFLSSVAGEALTKHLYKILPALIVSLSEKMGTPDEKEELEYCQSVVLSVQDDVGIRIVMDELLTTTTNSNTGLRCASVTILRGYCQQTKSDCSEYVPQLFRGVIHLFTDTDEQVLLASWECLSAITKKLDASEMLGHIANVRQSVRFAVSDMKGEELPGFCIPKKGITPILPIFREGILNGPPELKESAAIGLGEVIKVTSAEALKPSVVNITGPLIRILGDRFTFNVKVAVLETLGLLLGKCGAMLKPFLPQLQTTFIKALNDPNRTVRLRAANALGKLIVIHTRVDPLFTELHTAVKNTDDAAIKDTMFQALRGCISGAGQKMSDGIRKQITATLESFLSVSEDTTRVTAAACLGALCQFLTEEELALVMNMHLLDNDSSSDWTVRHGRGVALTIALKESSKKIMVPEFEKRIVAIVLALTAADRVPLCLSGLRSVGYLSRMKIIDNQPLPPALITALTKGMKHESNDVKILVAQVSGFLAKSTPDPLDKNLMKAIVSSLVNGTREKNSMVKSQSEFALVAVLRLRQGDNTLQVCLGEMESGMRESLNEVTNKTLRKVATQVDNDEDIDDTLLR